MSKVIIIGNSCSGKTTLGRKLSEQSCLPQIDLDELHWLPNWEERPDEEFIQLLATQTPNDKDWIVSGNYTSVVKDSLWKKADTIIWLDYSLALILYRFTTRTFKRVVRKEPCCNGNYESLRTAFFSRDALIHWVIGTHYAKRKKFKAYQEGEYKDRKWIVCKNPKEAEKIKLST